MGLGRGSRARAGFTTESQRAQSRTEGVQGSGYRKNGTLAAAREPVPDSPQSHGEHRGNTEKKNEDWV